jgi:ribosomal protein S7
MDNILYLQKMKQFFLRQGKKNVMEKLFKEYLLNRAQTKKDDLNKILLDSFMNSVPHVKLKTRRKGKKVMYKVGFVEKEDGMRKALLSFSKNLNENRSVKFANSLEKELENLSSGKSSIMAKRNEIHRIALENAPYSWTIKSNDLLKK